MAGPENIQVKRVYDDATVSDGTRVLVDRLWPRGVSKDEAGFDSWNKEVAPSPELRMWYGHDPARFEDFAARYRAELASADDAIEGLLVEVSGDTLTLLTATKDVDHSHAVVLADILRNRG
ncbi:DUF488 domain-containing protein [Solicola gregarius]|uniref:DUF488 domain-containing protein n=1 Tax=Solicola gregarius TaxID=2908642 RepID=A0AA46TMM5_9ACTN|nr:DUF488 domain-containing protein [Solicola gregarius]UYM07193.1 DUF488 domain-containing protein [Solicola gregarius]